MKQVLFIKLFLILGYIVSGQSLEQKSLDILVDTLQFLKIDINKSNIYVENNISNFQTSKTDLFCFNDIKLQSYDIVPAVDSKKSRLRVPKQYRYNIIRKIFKRNSNIVEVFTQLKLEELTFVSIKIKSSKESGYNIIFKFDKKKNLIEICTNEWII